MYVMHDETGAPDAAGAPAAAQPEVLPFNVQTHFAWLRTRLSAERTLMAWNRTSLSLIGFGFTIYQFFDKFQEATAGPNAPHPEAPRNLGLALILVGTAGTLIALWQYWLIVRYLRGDEFKPNGPRGDLERTAVPLTFLVACVSALIGIATTFWIVTRG
jgi:putative membrane protein